MKSILISLLILFVPSFAFSQDSAPIFPKDEMCVLIYFDQSKDPKYELGEIYSAYLQNILGHFPELIQIISPIERYQKGEIEKCRSAIYIGSYFDNSIPEFFFTDFSKTKKNVAWLGYNIWNFQDSAFENIFGFSYDYLTTLNTQNLNAEGNPSFYRYVEYKGEQFEKFAKWVDRSGTPTYAAPFEQVALKPTEDLITAPAEVLAESRHDFTGEKLPYAIRKNNHFFVTDIPFSYVHESDRYLVFSDLLFDILDLPPRHSEKLAVMRIEDVHPKVPLRNLLLLQDVFKEQDVPLHIALVPIFYDPLYRYDRLPEETFLPMTSVPQFMSWLKGVQDDGGVFIWHGATHQYQNIANPHSGYSSDDFEFWDAVNNKPVEDDSVDFVLDRLDLGMEYLLEANILPRVWLTPHYQASALDYHIFANVFDWNIGRAIYFLENPAPLTKDPQTLQQIQYHYKNGGDKDLRRLVFKDFKTDTRGEWFGQLYPYEIYGDIYGQKMFPEVLGNPQPFTSDHVWYPRSLEDILEDARRNLILRDTWAASFFHPYILTDITNGGVGDFPGDTRPLKKLLKDMKDLGYKFVNLEEFAEKTKAVPNTKRIKLKP